MISEFHQLADKITRLVALAEGLRRENAELRVAIASVTTENAELSGRIEEAYRRVTELLAKIPADSGEKEGTA